MMKLGSVNIAQTASAVTIIFEALRKAIVEGQLEDGEPLRQDDIARMFNTSRIPVREAISRLEQLGLVKTERFKGAVVASISTEEAAEIFGFRALVESELIRQSVPKMSAATIEAAHACCEAFYAANDPMVWGELNRELHRTLYADSGLTFHLEITDMALDRVDRFLRAQIMMTDGMERANREHREIVAACAAGDADGASNLIRQHILGARAGLLKHLPDKAPD